jgi:hypothetical protein
MSRNAATLASFIAYCNDNPEERFWQALRNWCGYRFVLVSNSENPNEGLDTFQWEHRNDDIRFNRKI